MYTTEDRKKIYDKTDGQCHICHKKIHWSNYSFLGQRGAWEVDHSNPKANGGSNRLSNLLPACVSCNRAKGSKSTRSERAKYGNTKAPESKQKKEQREKRQNLWILVSIFVTIIVISYYKNIQNENEEL